MFPWNFFPFDHKKMKDKMLQMNPEELNQWIQETMGNMHKMFQSSQQGSDMNSFDMMKMFRPDQGVNNSTPSQKDSAFHYTVYETHHDIFVRITIKNEEWLKRVKLYHTAQHMIVQHIPEEGTKHKIPLPALAKRKGTTAQYKDQVLEVRIPKHEHTQYSEVDITEI